MQRLQLKELQLVDMTCFDAACPISWAAASPTGACPRKPPHILNLRPLHFTCIPRAEMLLSIVLGSWVTCGRLFGTEHL